MKGVQNYILRQSLPLLLLLYIIGSIVLIIKFKGVGTEADSITHFLIAKYAPQYPELFLDHWGKPIFTLLASPFAQWGFVGIKIFNALCVGINLVLIFKICRHLNFKFPALAGFFYLLFPLTLSTTYTGLTEPLFASFLITAIWLLLKGKVSIALVLISFTPFIRSEGLIIILAFGLFQSLHAKWKSLPYLLAGHLLFALIGAFYFKDFFWVFNRIPYANIGSPYGSGDWFHFFDKMTYVMGIPLMILFWLGFVGFSYKSLKKGFPLPNKLFIPACFLAFFLAHSLFWSLGIFNSMGLKRVFAALTPLMAILTLWGFENIFQLLNHNIRKVLQFALLGYILVFPFTSNPAATDFKSDLSLTEKQLALSNYEIVPAGKRLVYADPYLSLRYGIDPFNPNDYLQLHRNNWELIQKGDLIIWDNWHAPVDGGIEKERLEKMVIKGKLNKVSELGNYYRVYVAL